MNGADLHRAQTGPGPQHIFTQARNDFLSLLSPAEQADLNSCSSVQDLIGNLERFQHFSNGGRRVKRCLEKVKHLGDNLEPYFKIMEIFCGAHPEWANIALGSLQLVLQLAGQFVSFFEKLCNVVETLNARLPRYQELYDSLVKQPAAWCPSLQCAFQRLYCHLFEFYGAVARIFSKKCGKLRRTPFVVTSLMWQPFDTRFQNILEKIKFDQNVVKEELQYASMGDLRAVMQGAAEKGRQETLARLSTIHAMQAEQAQRKFFPFPYMATQWLDPPVYKAALEQAQDHRAQGTNEWLQDDPILRSWKITSGTSSEQDVARMLWICGNPGSGKTVLAASVIDELMKNNAQASQDSLPEVCYYFFSQNFGTRNSPVDAYRAIAAQILGNFYSFEKVNNLFALGIGSGAILQKASENEIVETISQCLPHLPNLYFVIDAIDECSQDDRLIRQLSKWCESSPLKTLVLSRPDVAGLRRRIPKDNRILLSGATVDSDIACYLEPEIEDLVQQEFLSDDVDQSEIMSHLVHRAEGMFLWARLIVGYLNGPAMDRAQRLRTIMEVNTEGLDQLDEMYKRIEARISAMDLCSKGMARKSLMWVAHAKMSPEALKEALFPEGWDMEPRGTSEQFEHAVIVVCGGLVEKGTQYDGCFRYIHLTALEFVQRSSSKPHHIENPLVPSAPVSKALIATRCISLLDAIPPGPLSGHLGEPPSQASIQAQWPLLSLATNWMAISLEAIAATAVPTSTIPDEVLKMANRAYEYLANSSSIMVWVEAWYLLRASPNALDYWARSNFAALRDSIVDLCNISRHDGGVEHYVSELRDFVNDMIALEGTWGSVLCKDPHEIWGDVTVFTKSRFLVSTKAAAAQCLAPEMMAGVGEGPNKTVRATFHTSKTSADGRQLAILSIFPTEYFRKGWEGLTDIPSLEGSFHFEAHSCALQLPTSPFTRFEFYMACSDWLATYEIFSIEEIGTKSIHLSTIPLKPYNIELCLRQSLRFSPGGCWKCRFPLTIAPGLSKFSILNSVYHFGAGSMAYAGTEIPLSINPRLEKSWLPDSERHLSYFYELVWSPDSRYIAFADLEASSWAETDGCICIAIFSVATNISRDQPPKPIHSVSLQHNPPTQIRELPTLIHESSTVGFSHCGTAIAIVHAGREWPQLVPLSSLSPEIASIQASARKRGIEDEHGVAPERTTKRQRLICEDTNSNMDRSVAAALNKIPSVLSTSSVAALQGKRGDTPSDIALVKSHTQPNQIDVVYGNKEDARMLSICKLPSHIPLHSASADIMVCPSSYDTSRSVCTLVVNSDSAHVYESDDRRAAENLPLVVWKVTLALRENPILGGPLGTSSKPRLHGMS
ncbi:hypothetical protein Daus18300_012952 [Diaporthe australafricana]|uniref:NACHT domain-containing protein n=1 Tax=Diaporthe australafricana TaxID=127596 RepID=A0ABR3W0Z2_9PEZI